MIIDYRRKKGKAYEQKARKAKGAESADTELREHTVLGLPKCGSEPGRKEGLQLVEETYSG